MPLLAEALSRSPIRRASIRNEIAVVVKYSRLLCCSRTTALTTSRCNAKQFDQISAEDGFPFSIVQESGVEDEIDADRPVIGIVGPIDNVTDADFSNQMSQPLLVKNHRVDIKLVLEILTRFFLKHLAVGATPTPAQRVRSTAVGGEIPAGVSCADFESGKTIQRSFKNKMREEDCSFQRISDRVAQTAFSLQPWVLCCARRVLWVHEQQYTQFLRLGPERIELPVG